MDHTDYDTRLAAYAAVVDRRDRLLLTWFNGSHRSPPGWTMPGGGVEFDESLEAAVVREVREETGYAVQVGEVLTIHHFTRPDWGRDGRPYKSLRIVFRAGVVGGRLGTTEVGGTTDFAEWVPLAQVRSLEVKADIVDLSLDALGRG